MERARAKSHMSAIVTVIASGRLTIPAAMRAKLGIVGEQRLIASIVEGALVLETVDAAVERARAMLAPYLEGAPSLANEWIAERHVDAERE